MQDAGGDHASGPRDQQIATPDSLTVALRTAFQSTVAANLPSTGYAAHFGPTELLIHVDGPRLAFAAGGGIRRVISGELAPDQAITTGVVEVLHRPGDLLQRFARTFHLAA